MSHFSLRFLYVFCHDLASMRHFYSELIGLQEVYYAPGDDGGLAYTCDGLQFTIFPTSDSLSVPAAWHQQPGWQGGTLPEPSWSITCESDMAFRAALQRLGEAQVSSFFDQPQWLGYWSFPVKDPMGNTVELTLPVSGEPQTTTWF
jgi:catechol 2,3-dioxygenase-like lactoylglutathione lyase family enzyme